jgi:methionyl-tRNA synthetase
VDLEHQINWQEVDQIVHNYSSAMQSYSFNEGFKSIEQLLTAANTHLSENKFWTLVASTD